MQDQSSIVCLVAKHQQADYGDGSKVSGVYQDVQTEKRALLTTPLPKRPWKVIGTDLDKKHYLLVVNYFSRYPEVILQKSTTSVAIIESLKSIFLRYGIPTPLPWCNLSPAELLMGRKIRMRLIGC